MIATRKKERSNGRFMEVPRGIGREPVSTTPKSAGLPAPEINPKQVERFRANSGAVGALAVGALAVGAFSIGAMAIGFLAVRRLALGKARIRSLKIQDLEVQRLRVNELYLGQKSISPTA
jgi:hypothetical protein